MLDTCRQNHTSVRYLSPRRTPSEQKPGPRATRRVPFDWKLGMPRPDRGGPAGRGRWHGAEQSRSREQPDLRCEILRGLPLVAVMRAAANRERDQPARSVNWLGLLMADRRVSVQPLVRTSNVVVIVDELIEQPLEKESANHSGATWTTFFGGTAGVRVRYGFWDAHAIALRHVPMVGCES